MPQRRLTSHSPRRVSVSAEKSENQGVKQTTNSFVFFSRFLRHMLVGWQVGPVIETTTENSDREHLATPNTMRRKYQRYKKRRSYRSHGRPLSRDEVKQIGRQVGYVTGFVCYFTGAMGAYCLNMVAYLLTSSSGHPIASGQTPNGALVGIGAFLGIIVTMVVVAFVVKAFDYPGRSFRMANASAATGSLVTSTAQGAGMAVTIFVMMLAALTVFMMWMLASIFLIAAIAM